MLSYVRPEAAHDVFARIELEDASSEAFAIGLLMQASVCVTPGAAFSPSGEDHVHMAHCVPDATFDRSERHFGLVS